MRKDAVVYARISQVRAGEIDEVADAERDRAQLWAIYFGLRALADPPLFLRNTQESLRQYLAAPAEPELQLTRVK